MYEITVDWGEANDTFVINSKEEYLEYMEQWETYYGGATEGLLSKGIYSCGIDTLILKEVFAKYEISQGALLRYKDTTNNKHYNCVNSLDVTEGGITEINTQECWFYEGKLCYDYECYAEYSVSDIYKYFDLVGEDGKLFDKEG
jgi:hypothetical protein